jgi:glycosyltransferase involved in cell wall biosynthesis
MKVLIDYQIFETQKYGGISRYFYEISKNLVKNNNIYLNILAGIHINQYIDESSETFCIGWKKPNFPHIQRISHAINESATNNWIKYKKPDIIHETYYYRDTKPNHNQKIIITIHDMVYEKFPHYFLDARKTCIQKKAAIDRADHIICVSENTKKDVIDIYNVPKEKLSVIYHGGPEILLPYSDEKQLFERPYLLFVGQRSGYKNFSNLLTAFSNSNTLKNNFSLICFGGGGFNSEELLCIKKQNLSDVHIKQFEGNDNLLNRIYSNAQAFIYPSLYEGFGIPILESMSNSCPVICSNTSCFPEIAGNAAHYFDPSDPESIMVSIESIVFSQEARKKLIMTGHNSVQKYNWKTSADSTYSVYQNLL